MGSMIADDIGLARQNHYVASCMVVFHAMGISKGSILAI